MEVSLISDDQANRLLAREEGHFLDFKAAAVAASKLTRTLSAFANADGGEVLIGVSETAPGVFEWDGFADIEASNGHIQHLVETFPYGTDFIYEFLSAPQFPGYVLRIQVLKTRELRPASNGIYYLRRGAQNLPVTSEATILDLKRAKGLISHENETIGAPLEAITDSLAVYEFMIDVVPSSEPEPWLRKQQLIVNDHPTVAGLLLFSDEPQINLPKADVKIYRYKTASDEGTRETLVFDPISIDGSLYRQIESAVSQTVAFTEQIQKMTDNGLVSIEYPREALHEVITNAVLHRDYSFNDDVHVRIFDNRIEVESPGRLPAHVTPSNILQERFARNPTAVRLINKFPNPPNKDVGEGLNTAFRAMEKLRLREPEIIERDNSVLVVIRHESLASPEQQIVEFLQTTATINNRKAREVTGLETDHAVRRTFKKLVAAGEIEQVPGTARSTTAYRLPAP